MKALAAYNIKGGVGKTATVVNLAYLSAREGNNTLIWDLDPQGAASFYFRIKPKVKGGARKLLARRLGVGDHIRGTDYERLDLLPADFSYRHLDLLLDHQKRPKQELGRLLKALNDEYEFIFVDCSPGITLLSEAVFRAADVLLVPTIPTTLSLRTLRQLGKHLKGKKRAPLILPFFSMVDRRKSMHREISRTAMAPYPFLQTQVPFSSLVERMGLAREPIMRYAPKSVPSRAYQSLWEEIRFQPTVRDSSLKTK